MVKKIINIFIFNETKPNNPIFNMAADKYLFKRCANTKDSVFLRLYEWRTPAITIGAMQNGDNLKKSEKIPIIKRITGGRSIYHYNELTYSFTFPSHLKEFGTNIKETYEIISSALINGLAKCGIKAQIDKSKTAVSDRILIKKPCFISPSKYEILVNGKKLIGSAQKRGKNSVLQHGSLPIENDYIKIAEFEKERSEEIKEIISEKSIYIKKINPKLDLKTVRYNFLTAFEDMFKEIDANIIRADWTENDIKEINKIIENSTFKSGITVI